MPSATDDQIIAAYKNWLANPPAVSKMVAEGRDKKSKKSGSSDGSSVASSVKSAPAPAPAPAVADAPADGAKKKGRKPMSEEAKKAAAEKRAATKAAKNDAPSKTEPTSSAPAEDTSDGVMDFEPFQWKKMELLKNARGDVLTSDMEWFGKWDAKSSKVDTSAPQPSDLDL